MIGPENIQRTYTTEDQGNKQLSLKRYNKSSQDKKFRCLANSVKVFKILSYQGNKG